MEGFSFTLFTYLIGVGAASGLIYQDNHLKLISDDSDVLYTFHPDGTLIDKTSLLLSGELLENQKKSEKSDFEAIAQFEDTYYIFGSGSDKNRNNLIKFHHDTDSINRESLHSLYSQMRKEAQIKEDDFNIEGAILQKDRLLLFNRGNGPNQNNGIFFIENFLNKDTPYEISFKPIQLPKIQGVPFGFTDAIQVNDEIFFLAAAEAGESVYDDGEVLGSLFGTIDIESMELKSNILITKEHKLEGITLYEKKADHISFLLCEDPDDGGQKTKIFKLTLPNL